MIDAKNYSEQETLKNGLQVTIRAIRPDDKEAFLAAFRELESRTLHLRFFGQKKGLSPQELKQATEVDFTSTVSLAICIEAGESEKIIKIDDIKPCNSPPRAAWALAHLFMLQAITLQATAKHILTNLRTRSLPIP